MWRVSSHNRRSVLVLGLDLNWYWVTYKVLIRLEGYLTILVERVGPDFLTVSIFGRDGRFG